MIFTEFRFLAFFLFVWSVHWLLRTNRSRKIWLLIVSYAFYSVWDWKFLSLIIISTLADYVAGRKIHESESPRKRKLWLTFSLFVNLSLLGTFKYLGFFVDSASRLLEFVGFESSLPVLKLILPVGISFYTFQTLSYSLDIYFKRLQPVDKLLDLATFVAFFPQLVAGPIVRASDFLPQLKSVRVFPDARVRGLLILFLVGFFKKACVSDNITTYVDAFYSAPEQFGFFASWMGMILFSVQIYCDFSGYSDMAIACAGLLGYELRLNFDFPYLRSNIQEFWRTWHMSLSSWLRDYVYVPFGGNRGGRWATNRNLLYTMLIAGVWHGAGWTFVAFGAVHGLALVVYREYRRARPADPEAPGWHAAAAVFGNFLFVTYAWVFFRAADFGIAWTVTLNALGLGGPAGDHVVAGPFVILVAVAALHFAAWKKLLRPWLESAPAWAFSMVYGVAFPVTLSLMNGAVQPFIYFQF